MSDTQISRANGCRTRDGLYRMSQLVHTRRGIAGKSFVFPFFSLHRPQQADWTGWRPKTLACVHVFLNVS